jgi:ParB-like chromosome segregation protein Spo0J
MAMIAEGVEIDSVPAIAEPRAIGDAERTARLITLNGGEPLSGLEKAEVVRRLMGYGWTREKIAARLGFKTTQQVANLEKLLEAPQDVRDAVRAGELSATNAVAMVRSEGAEGAGAALALARETTKAKGKTKITARSLPQTKPEATKPQGNQGMLDKAIALLKNIVANDYDARTAATLFMMRADDVSGIIEWLTVFEDRLRDREEERREASVSGARQMMDASLRA